MEDSQKQSSQDVQMNFVLGQTFALQMAFGLLFTCLERQGLAEISGKFLAGLESAEFNHMIQVNFSPPPWSKPGEGNIGTETPAGVPVGFNEGVMASLDLLRKIIENRGRS